MKNVIKISFLFLTLLICSCDKTEYKEFNIASPEVMTLNEFRKSAKVTLPTDIKESGKIYAYNNLILVNDIGKGIHVLDNSSPTKPKKIAFIKIWGNNDMEIRGNYLYADSLMDLVVFDISDINAIKEVSRLKDVFNNYVTFPSVENLIVDYKNFNFDKDDIIVGWNIKTEYREVENIEVDFENVLMNGSISAALSSSSTGTGGSLARFKVVDDYLYTVDSYSINVFKIDDIKTINKVSRNYVGFGIETIFNKDNNLFLGSTNGMYIYNLDIKENPEFVSKFTHATACDPVVVDDEFAYVTLRGGNSCGAFESSLEIIDIKDLKNPSLAKRYSMENPYGLGVKNDLLFICDGNSGLKVYNKKDITNLKLVSNFKNVNAFDVIPLQNKLLMIGSNVLYQYKYSENGINYLSEFYLN